MKASLKWLKETHSFLSQEVRNEILEKDIDEKDGEGMWSVSIILVTFRQTAPYLIEN